MIFVDIQAVPKPYPIHFTATLVFHTTTVSILIKYQSYVFFTSTSYQFRQDCIRAISIQTLSFPLS